MLVPAMTLASPFGDPDPLARSAAEELAVAIRQDAALCELLYAPNGGKMFGVLIARDAAGTRTVLRAFSGMLADRWDVDGFVGPTFDRRARDAFWIEGEAALDALSQTLVTLDRERDELRARLAPIEQRHARELSDLAALHRSNKAARRHARARLGSEPDLSELRTLPSSDAGQRALDELAQQSRRDTAERKQLVARHQRERAELEHRLAAVEDERARLARARAEQSRALLVRIQDTYRFTNARGQQRSLRDMFSPDEPPGGAGDCAAPKLFAEALRRQLVPVALAEIWIGAQPATGGRLDGVCYPACRAKCGPILKFMLEGLAVADAPVFGAASAIADEHPRTIFEDDWIAVVEKPVGLLSVPGKGDELGDCVVSRLRERYPSATGPLVVHRLDLDTSGLMLVAKDEDTYKALQRQFAERAIDKRYAALLDGVLPASAGGIVELALRVDLDDRPRQLHDPVHGKPAVTEWRVASVDRERQWTRVALVPRTGRTHQLRVHAAHPRGIGLPIVGDRLYGRRTSAARLMLHAESLGFTHPRTGQRMSFDEPAPF